jgi:uncharacterized protein involved in exopolysaccharide biosynthesis
MSRLSDTIHTRDAYLGPHYQDGSLGPHYEEKLGLTLAKVWRSKLLVIASVTFALMLGIALALMTPKTYTAEAYIREGFATKAVPNASGGPAVGVDASVLIETRSRLLQSRQLARKVINRLGMERIGTAVGKSGPFASWLSSTFYGDAASAPGHDEDIAVERLLHGLSVTTEPRVYGVVVRYSAGNPDLAALITNAFVVEFREAINRQFLSQQRDSAERALSESLATFGQKHPKVMEAKARLQAVDALLTEQSEQRTTEGFDRAAEDGNVSLAQPVTIPSSPNTVAYVGVALFIGAVGGILLAVFRSPPRTTQGL